MRLLVVTNLYPPQELGGYGRCIADYVWGLSRLGHICDVICHNASYLDTTTPLPDASSANVILRSLKLKGSYENGLTIFTNSSVCREIDLYNFNAIDSAMRNTHYDGILLGNIDLLGAEILHFLLKFSLPILHHIGFIQPPFDSSLFPHSPNYVMVSASRAVQDSLVSSGFPVQDHPVVFPGVRTDLLHPLLGLSPILYLTP